MHMPKKGTVTALLCSYNSYYAHAPPLQAYYTLDSLACMETKIIPARISTALSRSKWRTAEHHFLDELDESTLIVEMSEIGNS